MATDINKARLAALKRIGLLTGISSQGDLTTSQKRKVRETYQEYADVLNAPKETVKRVSVKKYSTKERDLLRAYGFKIANDIAFIPKTGYQEAHLRKKTVYQGKGNKFFRPMTTGFEVERIHTSTTQKKEFKKTQKEFIAPIKTTTLEGRVKTQIDRLGELGPGQFYGIRTKGRGEWKQRYGLNEQDIYNNVLSWSESGGNPLPQDEKEKLMRSIIITKTSLSEQSGVADTSHLSLKERNRLAQKRHRQKIKNEGKARGKKRVNGSIRKKGKKK